MAPFAEFMSSVGSALLCASKLRESLDVRRGFIRLRFWSYFASIREDFAVLNEAKETKMNEEMLTIVEDL